MLRSSYGRIVRYILHTSMVIALLFAAPLSLPHLAAAPTAPPAAAQRFVIVPGVSSVTYRVNETLFEEGNRLNTAVGTTTAVQGEIMVDRTRPINSRIGRITIDISQFKSDSVRRDNAIRRQWLESAKYPKAEFTTTEIKGLPDSYQSGREIPVQITGNLKIRDVVRPATFQATIRLDGNTLTVTGTTMIKITDFGFDPPSIIFLKTENDVRLEFKFLARG